MPEQPELKTERVIRIGPDRVTITPDEVIIDARRELPDWQVRDFKVIPIYFQEQKHYLVQKCKAQPPYALRYVLKPWPETGMDSASTFLSYDPETVVERDAGHRSAIWHEVVRVLLLPLYPVLGLLWTRTQQRFVRFGFVPRVITCVSLFTVFAVAVAEAAFTAIVLNASGNSGTLMVGGFFRAISDQPSFHIGPLSVSIGLLDMCLLASSIPDAAIRFTHFMKEDQWTGGFLEWLVPRRRRKQ